MSLFPQHKTYVEAFFGGGAVFFEKEPSAKEVVNDLDPVLMADYKRVASAPPFSDAYPILNSKSAQDTFLNTAHSGKPALIVESLLRRCNGFGGNYIAKGSNRGVYTDDRPHRVFKVTTHERKLRDIGAYRTRLAGATLLTTTYAKVFDRYDAPDSFFFLDPPYEMSTGIGYAKGSESFEFEALADALHHLRGKFLVTINDSPYIRKVFKGFNLYRYVVKGHHSEKSGIGAKDRPELLITNYTLPKQWKSRMTKGILAGGKFSALTHREHVLEELGLDEDGHPLDELAEASGVPEDVLQQVYNRGIGAYKTNPTSVRMKGSYTKGVDAPMRKKLSKEQWAMARVYSFLDGNPKHDQDLHGGISRENAEKLRAIRSVQKDIWGSAKEMVRNIRVVHTFLTKEGVLTERDLAVAGQNDRTFGQNLADLGEVLTLYEDTIRDEGDFQVERDDPMSTFYRKLAETIRALNVEEPIPMPKGKGIGDSYMTEVRRRAKAHGYDPRAISYATDGIHKLAYTTPSGKTVRFGREGYGDHILWTEKEKAGDVPKGTASKKREVFHKSHEAIKGKWRENPYSPNMLALKVLW